MGKPREVSTFQGLITSTHNRRTHTDISGHRYITSRPSTSCNSLQIANTTGTHRRTATLYSLYIHIYDTHGTAVTSFEAQPIPRAQYRSLCRRCAQDRTVPQHSRTRCGPCSQHSGKEAGRTRQRSQGKSWRRRHWYWRFAEGPGWCFGRVVRAHVIFV